MPAPGQNPTDISAVLLGMVAALVSSVPDLTEANTYITGDIEFQGEEYAGDMYVQIVCGSAEDSQLKSNVPIIDEEVRVGIFRRLHMDLPGQLNQSITNPGLGILALTKQIEGVLINNTIQSLLLMPLAPSRRTPIRQAPMVGSGWSGIERVFKAKYLTTYPDIVY